MPRYPIKAFKGILADGGQDKIYLAGGDSSKGYRIAKFQIFSSAPGITASEPLVQIFKTKQDSVPTSSGTVDFTDDSLLAVAFWKESADYYHPLSTSVVFEQEVVNQDIFITHTGQEGTLAVNYYLELEEVTMSDAEAANVNFVAALTHT